MSSFSSSSKTPKLKNKMGQFLCDRKKPLPLVLRKATTLTNPARRFLCCPHPSWSGNQCDAYYFVDDELPSDYYKYEMYNLIQQAGRQNKQKHPTDNTQIAEIGNEMHLLNTQIAEMGNEMHLLKAEFMNMEKKLKECRKNVVFYKRVVMVMLVFVILYLVK
ncbi:hypothetical protein Tco_0651548 [Tanacetum coccineum]|uniref:Uncharacterized protein n=1 Tax=Tanacetum coccineum TaxID=301880 RepID=A0ABQ4WV58_9ASTR